MINNGREWDWMDNNKDSSMIYRDIEKIVLSTPNDMELGRIIRELYLKELKSNDE